MSAPSDHIGRVRTHLACGTSKTRISIRAASTLAACALMLTACTPSGGQTPTGDGSTHPQPSRQTTEPETDAGAEGNSDASIAEIMAEFPTEFHLPQLKPVAAKRTNYSWTIDYSPTSNEVVVERAVAEGFADRGFTATEMSDEARQTLGPADEAWAWESDEFRALIGIANVQEHATLRYVVDWK